MVGANGENGVGRWQLRRCACLFKKSRPGLGNDSAKGPRKCLYISLDNGGDWLATPAPYE